MGNSGSRTSSYTVTAEELKYGPHHFYLYHGESKIAYRRDRLRGPLLYQLTQEYDAEEDGIEHATTLDLPCAVPRRQNFELISPAALDAPELMGNGLCLRFGIASEAAPTRVRVLSDVSLAYVAGEGLQLTSGTNSDIDGCGAKAPPRCLYRCTPSKNQEVILTPALVHPKLLRAVDFLPVATNTTVRTGDGGAGGAQGRDVAVCVTSPLVSYAPLVIEVDLGTSVPEKTKEKRDAEATTKETSPTVAQRGRIRQFTLLQLPPDAVQRHNGSSTSSLAMNAPPLLCKLVRQLLQVGTEVYNVEDVFDAGHEEGELLEMGQDTDSANGRCVICLTNEQNTTLLPCRHMCLCSTCAAHLRLSSNKCPMCRAKIVRLMTL